MLFANFENKKTALLSRFVKNKLGAYFFSSASSSSMAKACPWLGSSATIILSSIISKIYGVKLIVTIDPGAFSPPATILYNPVHTG